MIKDSWHLLTKPFRYIRRIFIALIGGTVVLLGIIMLVAPGPAFIVIPSGLGILAIEFAWARRLMKKAKMMFQDQVNGRKNGFFILPRKNTPTLAVPRSNFISRDEINRLPLFKYDGPIHLIRTDEQVVKAVSELRKEQILGFDIETRPSFQKGERHPPALLQLAGHSAVYIFQLLQLRDVAWFKDIFSDSAIIKAGVSIDHDIQKLKSRQDFREAGFVELSKLSDAAGIRNNGLRGLAAILLKRRISKGAQRSNWSRRELSREQLVYAATDAYISRAIYLCLSERSR